jgi:hypothetical protein
VFLTPATGGRSVAAWFVCARGVEEEFQMALLYLIDDELAVDEDGWEWLLDADGAWHPKVEWKRPELRLVVAEAEDSDYPHTAG